MTAKISISIKHQSLSFYSSLQDNLHFKISSAINGAGQRKNSNQTPLGKHIVRAKIGGECQKFSVFEGRRFTGEIWSPDFEQQSPRSDWILSRVIWLSGQEIGFNRLGDVDTMQRYIYIHGTNEENLLGQPSSHGCIRMANDDVMQLFDLIKVGDQVNINEA